MTLDDLATYINDSTVVTLYSASSGKCIGEYDGKDSISERFMNMEITDIFTDIDNASPESKGYATLCIELDDTDDEDYEE